MENFANTHDKFWQKIVNGDLAKIAHNTGVLYDDGEGTFKVRVIDETYVVNPFKRSIYREKSPQEVTQMAKGRCMKCKKEVEIKDGQEIVMKNGMKAVKGVCPDCGTKVFRILGKA